MVTIAEALEKAIACFIPVSDSPQLDGQLLLADVLKVDRGYLLAWPDNVLKDPQYALFQVYVERRAHGEPMAYILGKKEFWGLSLTVTPDTLIPRPDTELLVQLTLEKLQAYKYKEATVLDLGTGSGAIALALAHERPLWQLCGVDNSAASLAVAEKNRSSLALNHVHFIQSHWFSGVEKQLYDAIVSNPPYISSQDPHLKALSHEPSSALVAENSGLAHLITLMEEAPYHLKSGGWLLLEHGYDQEHVVQGYLKAQGCYNAILTHKDLGGNPRVTVAQSN